jgi:hypothetical protein
MVYTAEGMTLAVRGMTELEALKRELCLIVTDWPGQGKSEPFAAPQEMRRLIELEKAPPFVRKATASEIQDYAMANRLFTDAVHRFLLTVNLIDPT